MPAAGSHTRVTRKMENKREERALEGILLSFPPRQARHPVYIIIQRVGNARRAGAAASHPYRKK